MPIVTTADMIRNARGRISAMRIAPPTGIESSKAAAREFELAIDVLEHLHEIWSIVEQLRAPEGAEVTLICDNPDFGAGANSAVEVVDDWTGPQWEPRRFEGDTILDALCAAKAARDAHVEIERERATGADELERHEGNLEDRERG